MQHFFADPSCVDGEQIRLAGSDVNHMKNVLRMKPGEEVWVSDGEGMDYFCSVEGLSLIHILTAHRKRHLPWRQRMHRELQRR